MVSKKIQKPREAHPNQNSPPPFMRGISGLQACCPIRSIHPSPHPTTYAVKKKLKKCNNVPATLGTHVNQTQPDSSLRTP